MKLINVTEDNWIDVASLSVGAAFEAMIKGLQKTQVHRLSIGMHTGRMEGYPFRGHSIPGRLTGFLFKKIVHASGSRKQTTGTPLDLRTHGRFKTAKKRFVQSRRL